MLCVGSMKTRPENNGIAREIEVSSLDLRYQSHRMKEAAAEGRLLASIAQRGIEEPLEGVEVEAVNVLLNGFKRYRCARKLQLSTVPYASLGEDEVTGILSLLRTSKSKTLGILEQAGFIDELKSTGHLSVAEIGVPMEIAMNLTIPEAVTAFNVDKLYKLIQNGTETWPGANYRARHRQAA